MRGRGLGWSWVLLPAVGLLCGCPKQTSLPPPAPSQGTIPSRAIGDTNGAVHLPHAQPKLRTLNLYMGTHEIIAELALSHTEIATGMMFRQKMAENEGMLFVFSVPHQTSFYMKNTVLPLTAAYIDSEGMILELHDLNPLDTSPVPASTDQVQYVLEMNRGWFDRHQIKQGTYLRTERGSFRETFFGSDTRR